MKLSWKWIILGAGVLIALVAITYGGSGYKAMRDWIVSDESAIVKELEKADLEHTKTEDALRKQLVDKDRQIVALDGKIDGLKNQIKNIIVPSNPDALVDAWSKRGIRARRNMPPR